jgi:cytoskeleton protein RodZ
MDDHPSATDDRETETQGTMTFGQKLRAERESRGLSLDHVSRTTRIGTSLLEALERDDFDALPGDVFVRGHIRAYAACLHADPDLVVQSYDLERQRRRVESPAAEGPAEAAVDEAARALFEEKDTKRRRGGPALLAVGGTVSVLAVLGALWVATSGTPESTPRASATKATPPAASERARAPHAKFVPVEAPEAVAPAEAPPSRPEDLAESARFEPEPKKVAKPAPTPSVDAPEIVVIVETPASEPEQPVETARPEPEPAPAPIPAPGTTTLTIPDHGVGTAVENRQLVGQSDRFSEGTQVWFWTDVRDGAGETIHHVWLREGVEMHRVSLNVGGTRWRTQSNKHLRQGSAGNWAVEARGDDGRVLIRNEFTVMP